MTPDGAVKALNDDALREIEALEEKAFFSLQGRFQGSFVPLTTAQRDALCATVRALQEREKNYARVLSDRLREMNALSELVACEHNSDPDSDCDPCGTCQTCLQSANTALRDQLALSERESEEFKRLAEGEVTRLQEQLARGAS